MALLNRAQILARKSKFPTKDVVVPEWDNETVRLRSLSARDREKVERYFDEKREDCLRAWLVSISLVNEANELLFSEEDVVALADLWDRPLVRLFDDILEFNGLNKKGVEGEEKNSGTVPNFSSPTGSPSPSANGTLTPSSTP